jgi:hypothetical protein
MGWLVLFLVLGAVVITAGVRADLANVREDRNRRSRTDSDPGGGGDVPLDLDFNDASDPAGDAGGGDGSGD